MPYAATTVATVIDRINRSYFLPAIQRPFVWSPEQVVSLFDSLMKGYPISSFLFWDVAPENKPHWQIYKFAEDFRFGEIHNELAQTDGRDVTLVLDGQQRLTSLLIGLRGSFTVKAKHKRWDSPGAWERKRLFLDLLSDPLNVGQESDDAPEAVYGFALFASQPKDLEGHLWLRVGEILNYASENAFDRFKEVLLERLPDTVSRADERTARRNLDRLYRLIWKEETICFYTEKDQDYDRVLGIFVRANDGGTKLSKSDLMLSMIASKWTDIPAREEIYSFVEAINSQLDRKNDISKDFVMKSCLLLSDLNHVYLVKNFTNSNLQTMRAKWASIKTALRRTFLLINRFGIDRDTLTSHNALLPIAYYLHRHDLDLLSAGTPFSTLTAERIRRWLIASLLNAVFGGNSDATIGIATEVIREESRQSKEFPLADLNEALSRHLRRPAAVSVDNVASLTDLTYGQKGTFLLLSLLYDEKGWGALPYHIDHIVPRARLSRKALMAMNLPVSRIEKILGSVDRIGNLQLLVAQENLVKNDQTFESWIASRDVNYRERHLIPTDPDLWSVVMLPEFVQERERLIRNRLLAAQGQAAFAAVPPQVLS